MTVLAGTFKPLGLIIFCYYLNNIEYHFFLRAKKNPHCNERIFLSNQLCLAVLLPANAIKKRIPFL